MHLNKKYIFITELESKLSEKKTGGLTLFPITLHFLGVWMQYRHLLPAPSSGFFYYYRLDPVDVSENKHFLSKHK